MSAKCIAYDQFVNFGISYPSSASSHFAVCLHHPALAGCAGDSTCVAVVAFPPMCPAVFLIQSGCGYRDTSGTAAIYSSCLAVWLRGGIRASFRDALEFFFPYLFGHFEKTAPGKSGNLGGILWHKGPKKLAQGLTVTPGFIPPPGAVSQGGMEAHNFRILGSEDRTQPSSLRAMNALCIGLTTAIHISRPFRAKHGIWANTG
jgi:hypothetical protein